MKQNQTPRDTSWERAAGWYDQLLQTRDTYQERVLLPNLMRLLRVHSGVRVLDVGCGQGYFARAAAAAGAVVIGVDTAASLVEAAQEQGGGPTYRVLDATMLSGIADGSMDRVMIVLALQNIEDARQAVHEAARVLVPHTDSALVIVLNHPAFRIAQQTSWQWDSERGIQYRRVDGYGTEQRIKIITHPADPQSDYTWSFHRPLQYYAKALQSAGLAITRIEEWNSHRTSQPGPRQQVEDRARAEFPLFMAIEARPFIEQSHGAIS